MESETVGVDFAPTMQSISTNASLVGTLYPDKQVVTESNLSTTSGQACCSSSVLVQVVWQVLDLFVPPLPPGFAILRQTSFTFTRLGSHAHSGKTRACFIGSLPYVNHCRSFQLTALHSLSLFRLFHCSIVTSFNRGQRA